MHSPAIIYPHSLTRHRFPRSIPCPHPTSPTPSSQKHAATAPLPHACLMNPILFYTKNSNTEIPTLTRHHARPPRLSKLGKTKQLALNQLIKRRITVYSIAQPIKGKRPLREICSTKDCYYTRSRQQVHNNILFPTPLKQAYITILSHNTK